MQQFNGIKYYKTARGYYSNPLPNVKTRRMHRAVWEFYNGTIPIGHIIHHIDKDRSNNKIENLQLMRKEDHDRIHKHDFGTSEKSKAMWANNKQIKHICIVCNSEFMASSLGRTKKYCSGACASKNRYRSKVDVVATVCKVCGSSFTSRKWRETKTCSEPCRRVYISKCVTARHKKRTTS